MSRDVLLRFPVEVPEGLKDEDVLKKGREAMVIELLRKGDISQGKAAELLAIDRHALFDLMDKYDVLAVNMTGRELKEELSRDISFGGKK